MSVVRVCIVLHAGKFEEEATTLRVGKKLCPKWNLPNFVGRLVKQFQVKYKHVLTQEVTSRRANIT
jgi:hypothetical protein